MSQKDLRSEVMTSWLRKRLEYSGLKGAQVESVRVKTAAIDKGHSNSGFTDAGRGH